MAKGKVVRGPGNRPRKALKVTRLDQVRALADPLRLRILEAFGQTPRTTKQVAELLGEKPTRLYHHVNALARVGLIVLRKTRQNRGAVEKYYAAAASRFELSSDVFAADESTDEPRTTTMARTVVDTARRELLEMLHGPSPTDAPVPPLVARAAIEAPEEELRKLHTKLMDLIGHCREPHPGERPARKTARTPRAKAAGSRQVRYALTILFHPVRSSR